MDLEEMLRQFRQENPGKFPWPHGICSWPSNHALTVWEILSPEHRLIISINNPLRIEREKLIKELWQKGCPQIVLHELTGVSKSAVNRICKRGQ